MEKLIGRKLRDPSMERQRGMAIQQRSPKAKRKIRAPPILARNNKGVKFPPTDSDVTHGAAIKKPRVMRPIISFWGVRLCTSRSVRSVREW